MSVVWECGSCGERSLDERRCGECNLFCSRVGEGGGCPACSELVASAELEATTEAGREAEHPVIGIDTLDAIELGEIVDYVGEWLAAAAPAVTASVEDYGGGPGAREILVEALARHGRALLGSVPA